VKEALSVPVELEDIGCLLCGDSEVVPAEEIDGFGVPLRYGYCSGCGLKFMHRRPTRAWYAAFYRDEFWQRKTASRAGTAPETTATARRRRIARQRQKASVHWDFLRRYVTLGDDASVLEIGAGFGQTLILLRDMTGCAVFAVEPSSQQAAFLANENGIPIVADTVEALSDLPEDVTPFDLVICSNVLENTTDPVAALRILRGVLKPDGRLFIETPDLYRGNMINPYHPYVFSLQTLEKVLGRAGLRIVAADRELPPRRRPLMLPSIRNEHFHVIAAPAGASPGENAGTPAGPADVAAIIRDVAAGQRAIERGRAVVKAMNRCKAWARRGLSLVGR
jgi:SAM-dependent methyltransferase